MNVTIISLWNEVVAYATTVWIAAKRGDPQICTIIGLLLLAVLCLVHARRSAARSHALAIAVDELTNRVTSLEVRRDRDLFVKLRDHKETTTA